MHLIPVGHSRREETCLEIGITEDEGEGTGRKNKGSYTSSLKGFRGDVQDLASSVDLNRKDGLHLCCDYSTDIIPIDIKA
jgi:hypothetical protein